ncbi:ABC transporter permease [Devosia ginsengisoli]|uniref:ABC transporter permease n=1 Tax=Devosia ginsengisoli TaxID=400770 RepID=UPI0026F27CBA|nr:ABC transporter permease [Devosia ginsengisoli]MCR6671679.1 ABC transporter permease [Devosia ginsengisoli]
MSELMQQEAAIGASRRPMLSPLNRRRLDNFRRNRRGYWSLWIFLVLFLAALGSEFIANDRPIIASYKGELLFPAFVNYPEAKFGGFLATTNYRDDFIASEIDANGWMVWPPVHFSYNTVDRYQPGSGATPPTWLLTRDEACDRYPLQAADPGCNWGNAHWLGTDGEAHDVLARLLYGVRISILFGFTLTILSSVIGLVAGAVQGYFGGWVDLVFQRVIEIWTSVPALYLLLIVSSVIAPSFWVLLGILLLFSWVSLVGIVRAEFLRGRNFEYIAAARALGVSNITIMFRHLLPNAMVATLTFMPFILSGSVVTLTSLDLLGLGLEVGTPSLGDLLYQGKENLQAPWLGLTGFFAIAVLMTLLVFIGEAVRDAFDPRKAMG